MKLKKIILYIYAKITGVFFRLDNKVPSRDWGSTTDRYGEVDVNGKIIKTPLELYVEYMED